MVRIPNDVLIDAGWNFEGDARSLARMVARIATQDGHGVSICASVRQRAAVAVYVKPRGRARTAWLCWVRPGGEPIVVSCRERQGGV